MRAALFLDRDGVINVDKGYVHKIEDWQWMPGIFDIGRQAARAGHLIIVITNQSGIGRGYFTTEQFVMLTDWMKERFEDEACPIHDVYMCPDAQPSPMRKPEPGMILQAAKDHKIDLPRSLMVGDRRTDFLAARAAGVGAFALMSEFKTNL